jgi:hypothetical protein
MAHPPKLTSYILVLITKGTNNHAQTILAGYQTSGESSPHFYAKVLPPPFNPSVFSHTKQRTNEKDFLLSALIICNTIISNQTSNTTSQLTC